MAKRIGLIALVVLSLPSLAWDVGFNDAHLFIKTKLLGKDLTTIAFYLCPIGRSNEAVGECLKLSSCEYPDKEVAREAKALKDKVLSEEIDRLTHKSYMSKVKSVDYLDAFLTLLDKLDTKHSCTIVTKVQFNPQDKNLISAQVRLPADFKHDEKAPLEKRLSDASLSLHKTLIKAGDKPPTERQATTIQVKELRLDKEKKHFASAEIRFEEITDASTSKDLHS